MPMVAGESGGVLGFSRFHFWTGSSVSSNALAPVLQPLEATCRPVLHAHMKTSTTASLALPPSTAVDSARLSIFWLEKDIQHLLARGLATPPNQIRRRAIGISPPQSISARELQK